MLCGNQGNIFLILLLYCELNYLNKLVLFVQQHQPSGLLFSLIVAPQVPQILFLIYHFCLSIT